MKIIISSRERCIELVTNNPNHYNVVSILEPGMQPLEEVAKHSKEYIVTYFHDIEFDRGLGHTLPSKEVVQDILEWAKDKDNLLVSCRAGQSRSSAIAYLIACQYSNPQEAIKILDEVVHQPNKLVVEIGSDILNDDDIKKEYDKWKMNIYMKLAGVDSARN